MGARLELPAFFISDLPLTLSTPRSEGALPCCVSAPVGTWRLPRKPSIFFDKFYVPTTHSDTIDTNVVVVGLHSMFGFQSLALCIFFS